MSEERKMILKMVDEGKITPEQAIEMLKATNTSEEKNEQYENYTKSEDFIQDMEKWAKDFAKKMGSTIKDLEPKLRKMTQIMVQNTVNTVEEIGKVFKEQNEDSKEDKEN
ncbi:SHOCT-like domain-containing protein [Defluviitalea phaphyphila]|uniref:SHOCT-like domain-containing protein n=1 Tax=Defluviitalea phaphyphila TaxID=1473580 RepID=UPI0007313187|nr:hypothetical protein [Defluviitalea phaphyphila]